MKIEEEIKNLYEYVKSNQELIGRLFDIFIKQDLIDKSHINCRVCKCFIWNHFTSRGVEKNIRGTHGTCLRHAPKMEVENKNNLPLTRVYPTVNSIYDGCFEGLIDSRKGILYKRFEYILNYDWKKKDD